MHTHHVNQVSSRHLFSSPITSIRIVNCQLNYVFCSNKVTKCRQTQINTLWRRATKVKKFYTQHSCSRWQWTFAILLYSFSSFFFFFFLSSFLLRLQFHPLNCNLFCMRHLIAAAYFLQPLTIIDLSTELKGRTIVPQLPWFSWIKGREREWERERGSLVSVNRI